MSRLLWLGLVGCAPSSGAWAPTQVRILETGVWPDVKMLTCEHDAALAVVERAVDRPVLWRARMEDGAMVRLATSDIELQRNWAPIATPFFLQDGRAYIGDDVFDLEGTAIHHLGTLSGQPGRPEPLGEHHLVFTGDERGVVWDVSDVQAPREVARFRLRLENTVTGLAAAARLDDTVVLLGGDEENVHFIAWDELLTSQEPREGLDANYMDAGIILDDFYATDVHRSAFRRDAGGFQTDGRYLAINASGDLRTAPLVIDPGTRSILVDAQVPSNNTGDNYRMTMARNGQWFEPFVEVDVDLPVDVPWVDMEAMVAQEAGTTGRRQLTPVGKVFPWSDLCWFPDRGEGLLFRSKGNEPWFVARFSME